MTAMTTNDAVKILMTSNDFNDANDKISQNSQFPVANAPVPALEAPSGVVHGHRRTHLRRRKSSRAVAIRLALAESFSLYLFRGAMCGGRIVHRDFGFGAFARQAAGLDVGDTGRGRVFEKSVGDAIVHLHGWEGAGGVHSASVGHRGGTDVQGDFHRSVARRDGGWEGLDNLVVQKEKPRRMSGAAFLFALFTESFN